MCNTQDEDAQESQRNSKGDSHIIDDWNLKAYTHLWGKCLDRVQVRNFSCAQSITYRCQEVIESLQQPLAKAIADTIQNTYNDSFPGLPRPELPFICVISARVLSQAYNVSNFDFFQIPPLAIHSGMRSAPICQSQFPIRLTLRSLIILRISIRRM